MTSRWARAAVSVAAALLVLAGCGDDDPSTTASDTSTSDEPSTSAPPSTPSETPNETPAGEEPTASEPAEPLPPCADIWVDDGRKLPGGYRGCSEGGADVPAAARECSFGKPLVTYGGRFYAVPLGPINRTERPLEKDRDYRSALASCTA